MAIAISQADYCELFDTVSPQLSMPVEPFETTWAYPQWLGQGYWREIRLRQGLELAIAHYRLTEAVTLHLPEREHIVEYCFHLTGGYSDPSALAHLGNYALCGSGLAPVETTEWPAVEQFEVNVHIAPEVFTAWVRQAADDWPQPLEHLVQSFSHPYYTRSAEATRMMQMTLQQLLHCPFQGLTKRLYLENKVWELMTLIIDQELLVTAPQKSCPTVSTLKPDDVDRIHQARAILLQKSDNPPSLIELARLVGLNDCTLKRGFRQVFGQTAFGLLHDYRLEQARQLLEERRLNISEITQAIGFANRSYFAAAFRKKFGLSPKDYRSRLRNSA
ncbi:MAG: AraC family transcriptional regulator [Oculatellaceae cyanobacterium Prado106]|jgi:AraC-like DNA-binding protein|nr:AraC family transcriptional regulator [Oculatellaceae cyanobacterium Prado106]